MEITTELSAEVVDARHYLQQPLGVKANWIQYALPVVGSVLSLGVGGVVGVEGDPLTTRLGKTSP